MKPLIIYKPNDPNHKFHLLIDVPEFKSSGCHSELQCENDNMNGLCGCWESYLEAMRKCKESSIGIEDYFALNETFSDIFNVLYGEQEFYINGRRLHDGDTFLLPDNVEFEIVTHKTDFTNGRDPDRIPMGSRIYEFKKLARLRLKEKHTLRLYNGGECKVNCNCIEVAENKAGAPVKSYPCLKPDDPCEIKKSQVESQEEIFDDMFSQYFRKLSEGSSMHGATVHCLKNFTITRKQS